jgi:hypothetical protein
MESGGRFLRYRRRFDTVVDSLIADARADPAFEERNDVLSLLVQARYDNGEPIPDRHIADELLTLVASGHETTSSALAWTVGTARRMKAFLDALQRLAFHLRRLGSMKNRTRWSLGGRRSCTDRRSSHARWNDARDGRCVPTFR